jgi:phosphopantetheine--protein transferase-like protein
MDIQTILRQTVAEFFQIAPEQVSGDLDFRGRMSGSVARARLDAAIQQRLKIICPQVHTAQTYAELEAAVLGKPLAATAIAVPATSSGDPQRSASATAAVGPGAAMENVACGIDLESPEQFPVEADYWESEFYRANFSRAEIAYCLVQADPSQHFAARWCAKESLKKCDAQYLSLEMNRIEVVLDESGRPALHLRSTEGHTSTRLPVAVSLTHLGSLAAAVVVKVDAAKGPAPASPSVSDAGTAQEASSSGTSGIRPRQSWWRRLFG